MFLQVLLDMHLPYLFSLVSNTQGLLNEIANLASDLEKPKRKPIELL